MYTQHDLTYLKHPQDDDQIGDDWLIATIDFGGERFSITTDGVHASELSLGNPEDDVRLWTAAPDLLTAAERALNALNDLIGDDDYEAGTLQHRLAAAIAKAKPQR